MARLDERLRALEFRSNPAGDMQIGLSPAELDAHFRMRLGFGTDGTQWEAMSKRLELGGLSSLTRKEQMAFASVRLSGEDDAPFANVR